MTTLKQALATLGLVAGQSLDDARSRYRELLLVTHPDVASDGRSTAQATNDTIAVTTAFDVIRDAVERGDGHLIPPPPADEPQTASAEEGCKHRPGPGVGASHETCEIFADGDTLFIAAPPPEAFAMLLEAGSRVGGIGYVDRNLGILELIVRFEGGPSCSVLITMQGRAFGTDAFITMESIEADPTPALAPVIDALLEELADLGGL
ncbi:MAG: hypothetical protein F2837_09005 [Actinobacteria bacterium]|uniref:Unannotated protein n=1 Tax=freshwater metagenome TaxID=449393 RepID=A0A6J7K2L4_9ZZZZ|nr:hypothetical protein [Actinomycetota bacterium]